MKKILVSMLTIVVFVVMSGAASAQTRYFRPYYEEKPLPEKQTYPYFLENATEFTVTVRLYVNKVPWEYILSPGHGVEGIPLPVGARVKVEVFADVGRDALRKQKKAKVAYYHRERYDGVIDRGWRLWL